MQPFIGEIRIFAGTFAPAGWAFCNGAIISISGNETLYTLLGTIYGGDGQSTFALPNLNGRVIVTKGKGLAGTTYYIGGMGGVESVTLASTNLPAHGHTFTVSASPGTAISPNGNFLAAPTDPTSPPETAGMYMPNTDPGFVLRPLAPTTITPTGGSTPHENRMPYLTINYIIATEGVFPTRN